MLRTLILMVGACAVLSLPSCSPRDKKEIRTYPMGERVRLGHLIYTVFETQWLTHLGEGAAARVPQQRFFLVRLSITNAGSSDAISPTLSLIDDSGQTKDELANGEGVPNWTGQVRQIKPAESAQGNVVFDVAPAHYKLRIADENEQNVGLVDIPLSFGVEAPQIPQPESLDAGKDNPKGAKKK